ncbi:MAG: VCBS repeat-containing protein [Planctomycetes bacterium]|nr:VCBS repeat-containing protein [Planctomycetota bacterium]
MKMPLAILIACLAGTRACAQVQDVAMDFGRELSDWYIYDADGDGRKDFLGIFYEGPGRMAFELALHTDHLKFGQRITGRLDDTLALAVGAFGEKNQPELVMVGATEARRFRVSRTEAALLPVGEPLPFTGLLRGAVTETPAVWHWSIDLDGDGHDDLHLPGDEGIEVRFGDSKGKTTAPLTLPIPGERRLESGGEGAFDFVRRVPHPIFGQLDADRRADLCWFDEGGLAFRRQTSPRSFGKTELFTLPWMSGQEDSDLVEQTDVKLLDIDGDGLDDLILAKMRSEKGQIGDMKSTLVVLRNRGEAEERFPRRPDAALRLAGVIGYGPEFIDVNHDGRLDLVYGLYGAGISDAVGRFFGKVQVQVFCHLGTGNLDVPFNGQPDFTIEEGLDSKDFEDLGMRNTRLLGDDLTGDGIGDLVRIDRAGSGEHKWRVFAGSTDAKQGFTIQGDAVAEGRIAGLEKVAVRTLQDGHALVLVLITKTGIRMVSLH